MISTKFIRRIISGADRKFYHRRVLPDKTYQNDEFFVFPREREGNDYWVNWSMTEDGITPVGESAFRNARLALLKTRLGISKDATELNVKAPSLTGSYKVLEAGDSLPHQDFADFKEAQRKGHLESGIDLFVEDGGLGAFTDIRVGVRIIASNPALALMGRNLFVRFFLVMFVYVYFFFDIIILQ
jgi:hypothetical protein